MKKLLCTISFIAVCWNFSYSQDLVFRFTPEFGGTLLTQNHPATNGKYEGQAGFRLLCKGGVILNKKWEPGIIYRFTTTFGQLDETKTGHGYGVYLRYFVDHYEWELNGFENLILTFSPYAEIENLHSNISSQEAPAFSTNNWNSYLMSPSIGVDIKVNERNTTLGFELMYDLLYEHHELYSIFGSFPKMRYEISYSFKL